MMQVTHDNDCEHRLGHDCTCGASNHLLDLAAARAEVERLTNERDEARAQVAAAYEAAANLPAVCYDNVVDRDAIRALTPADAKTAIEAYGRDKVREGMQRAADVLTREFNICDIPINGVTIHGSELAPPSCCRTAILDEMETLI